MKITVNQERLQAELAAQRALRVHAALDAALAQGVEVRLSSNSAALRLRYDADLVARLAAREPSERVIAIDVFGKAVTLSGQQIKLVLKAALEAIDEATLAASRVD